MPEAAGPANQSGIVFQNSIAALYLGRLCDPADRGEAEQLVRVRVEAPEDVDDIVLTYADGHREFIQAKERLAVGSPQWRDVWSAFVSQLRTAAFQRNHDQLKYCVGTVSEAHYEIIACGERARSTVSSEEWWGRLSVRGQKMLEAIAASAAPPGLNCAQLHELLTHVHVDVWPRRHMKRELVPVYCSGSSKESNQLFRAMRDRVGEQASVRQAFDAASLRLALFAEHGIEFRFSPSLDRLREACREASVLLRQHKRTFGRTGLHLARQVTSEIVDWALAPDPARPVAMLLDGAGCGKSAILRDVLEMLEAQNVTVIGLKADQQCAGIESRDSLRVALGFEDALERTVAQLARAGRVVVLVDQVDALSLSLARDQSALNVVLELVGRLRLLANVSIVMSCRSFDRATDPRLHRLEVGQEFRVTSLSPEEISTVVHRLGVEMSALSPGTRALLQTPLHLELFATLAASTTIAGEPSEHLRGVRSLQELYGLLWDTVVLRAQPRAPLHSVRVETLRVMVKRMHERQQVTLLHAHVPELGGSGGISVIDWLASAGILIRLGPSWGFLHQTFFDYCFARFFVEDELDLARFVLQSDQGLFVRSQVTHVLSFLRGTGQQAYLPSLRDLLTLPALRPHLRTLVWSWFGALPDPSLEEWALLNRFLHSAEFRPAALRGMVGNVAWLPHMSGGASGGGGVLNALLALPTIELGREVLPYLGSVMNADEAQAVVCPIVSAWFDREAPWPEYARRTTFAMRSWNTSEAQALFACFVEHTPLDQRHELFLLDDVAKAHPRFATALLARLFGRFRARFRESASTEARWRGIETVFEDADAYPIAEAIELASAGDPKAFAEALLPFVHDLLDDEDSRITGAALDAGEYAHDSLSGVYSLSSTIRDALLTGLVNALGRIAEADAAFVDRVLDQLMARPYTTAHELVARTLQIRLPESAIRSAAYLGADARRLGLGDEALLTRTLLRDLAPHVPRESLEPVQNLIASATGKVRRWSTSSDSLTEKRIDARCALERRGLDQLQLLRALPKAVLTSDSLDRLGALERKFPKHGTVYVSTEREGGWVGSPIDERALEHMSDVAWLGAMEKYSSGVTHPDFLKGGARELARSLESRVKMQPERFARLFGHVKDSVEFCYVEHVMSGLSDAEVPPELLFSIVRRFVLARRSAIRFLRVPRTVTWAVEKVLRRGAAIPLDILRALTETVSAPVGDEEAFYAAQSGRSRSMTLNTDRSAALLTLVLAFRRDVEGVSSTAVWELLERLVYDPSRVVRIAAMESLTWMFHVDAVRAFVLFETFLRAHLDLVETEAAQQFVHVAAHGQFGRLLPYVDRMLLSTNPDIRRRAAELLTIGYIADTWAEDAEAQAAIAERMAGVFAGDQEMRIGAAHILAHNLSSLPNERCADGLLVLSSDAEVNVRREAARCVGQLRSSDLHARAAWLQQFAASPAVKSAHRDFSEFLWVNAGLAPATALVVGTTLARNVCDDDPYDAPRDGADLVRLALRLHTDVLAAVETRSGAMDMFDVLVERFTDEAQQSLRKWDRV